jgi:hypothetical protein
MTIFEVLVASNAAMNKKSNIITPANVTKQIKKNINHCVKLLMLGYNLQADLDAILKEYKHISKVPDAKEGAGEGVTDEMMRDVFEAVYPIVPKNHLIMVMLQNFGEEKIHFVSNGKNELAHKALLNLANQIKDND